MDGTDEPIYAPVLAGGAEQMHKSQIASYSLTKYDGCWLKSSLQTLPLAIFLLILVWPFGCIGGIKE